MFDKIKGNILFTLFLKRPNIDNAYKMVGPEDSWYDTITKVHNSLAEIRQLPHEDWQIVSHDGLKLKALYYPGNSDKTMIWIHGYTSHAERESAFPSLFYHSMGFNVLIPYLRAHGPSEGKYISFGPMETMDLIRWASKVNDRIPDGQILFHGLSMGGGIALDLATREIPNVKAFVVDAPSYSIAEVFPNVAKGMFKRNEDSIAKYAMKRFQKEFSVDPRDFDRVKNICDGKYPLLLSAGSNEQMDEVLAQIKENNPKETQIFVLPGCNHGNGMYKQTEMYQSAIKTFVERWV